MRFRDASWWWVMLPLLAGHLAMFILWVWAGWWIGGQLSGGGVGIGALGASGALAGALLWWLIGTTLDWLGYKVSRPLTRGRYEFQPLAGAIAGWTLPVGLLLILAVPAALCWLLFNFPLLL